MSAAPAAPDGVETLVPVEILLEGILSRLAPLGRIEHVHLADAAGRTLAASVDALVDLPPFDNSAMDGYAMPRVDVAGARADAPVVLDVVADVPAGSVHEISIGPGQAARIMTGASRLTRTAGAPDTPCRELLLEAGAAPIGSADPRDRPKRTPVRRCVLGRHPPAASAVRPASEPARLPPR